MIPQRQTTVTKDFSYTNLEGNDLSNQDLLDCDFRHTNMRNVNLGNSNLHLSDFRGANLANATITLSCFTFRSVRFDDNQIDYLLYLLSLANISTDKLSLILAILTTAKKEKLDFTFGQR